jgi:hypothetical protein
MSHSSDSSGRHRPALDRPGQFVFVGTVLLVAWGVLAFGAPYPWAYTPLAIGAAIVGAVAWVVSSPTRLLADQRRLVVALSVVAALTIVQLIPLPARLVDTISPANSAILRQIDLVLASLMAAMESGADVALPARPLSIDPASTAIGLMLLLSFGLLLTGLLRHVNRFGARRFAAWFVGFGALVALIGIVQKALVGDNAFVDMKIYGVWSPIGKLSTPFGPFVNKNHFAGWMLMALPTALGYLLAQADVGLRHVRPGWRYKFLWLSSPEGGRLQIAAFAVVIMGVSLMMTLSRSGVAGFGLAMGMAAVAATRGQRSMAARLGVLLTLGFLVAAPILLANSNVAGRLTSRDQSLHMRMGIWGDTVRVIRDFPLVGTGLDTFAAAMHVYQTGHEDQNVREAHDDYLQLAAEGGLLVGVPIAATLIILVVAIRRRFTSHEDDARTSWIRFGAVTGLTAIALQSLVEFSLQMPGNAVTCVVLIAIALHRPAAPVAPPLYRV